MGDQWSTVQIQSCPKHLDLLVGPGRVNKIWSKAISKWQQRTKDWRGTGVGLQYSAMVYNLFCVSVLFFLAQLLEIPEEIIDREGKIMLMIASGPKTWAIETDLWRMGNQCSVGRSFHCVRARGQAAKLRAVHFENWERPIAEEARLLEDWRQTASQEDRGFHWNKCYNSSFAKVLWENKCSMATKGIALEKIKTEAQQGRRH